MENSEIKKISCLDFPIQTKLILKFYSFPQSLCTVFNLSLLITTHIFQYERRRSAEHDLRDDSLHPGGLGRGQGGHRGPDLATGQYFYFDLKSTYGY